MDDKTGFKNIIGKIGAIIFITIVIIVLLTFVGCMLESRGSTNEGDRKWSGVVVISNNYFSYRNTIFSNAVYFL